MARADAHLNRRTFTLLGLSAALHTRPAQAQVGTWPNKPIRLVVAFPPGGLADVLSRIVQPHLEKALGQPIVIDNRAGAGGNIAASEVARNGTDGHTFLVSVSTTESVNPVMFRRMPIDVEKELQPVAQLATSVLFLIAGPTLPVRTLGEFVAYAKAQPTMLGYGSPGVGTTPHLAGELFKRSAGLAATHVPYRGAAPAIQDVMAGQVPFAFAPGTVLPFAKAGKLKLLAIASRRRNDIAPAVPTFDEQGYQDVVADTLFGVYAPSSMPAAAVERMNRELNRVLAMPEIKARFVELGAEPVPLQPAAYRAAVREEARLFRDIVKSQGISAD